MSKPTPGPWIAIHSIPEEGFECFWLRAQPGGGICRGFSQEIGTINGPQSGEQEANARLIAAAPELLEACQTFAEWLRREDEGLPAGIERGTPEGERQWRIWWHENLRICNLAQEQVRAAIAKAVGHE